MKIKAVIFRPDRTNDVFVPKKKHLEGKTFKHAGHTYFLNPDRAQITWTRALGGIGWRRYFSTLYYIQGVSSPLPVPNFQKVMEPVIGANGEPEIDAATGKPVLKAVFPKIIDNGIPGDELAAIFNAWFYKIIAQQSKNVFEQIQFFIQLGTAGGVGYLIYYLHHNLGPLVEAAKAAAPAAGVGP